VHRLIIPQVHHGSFRQDHRFPLVHFHLKGQLELFFHPHSGEEAISTPHYLVWLPRRCKTPPLSPLFQVLRFRFTVSLPRHPFPGMNHTFKRPDLYILFQQTDCFLKSQLVEMVLPSDSSSFWGCFAVL